MREQITNYSSQKPPAGFLTNFYSKLLKRGMNGAQITAIDPKGVMRNMHDVQEEPLREQPPKGPAL